MTITTPSSYKSRFTSVIQAVMPTVRVVARFLVLYCVLVAARETFYPSLSAHSPELTLWRFGTVPVAWALLKAAQWQREAI